MNIAEYNSLKKYAKLIGFVHEYKTKGLNDILVNKSPMIMSIKKEGAAEVFDFNLQDDTHWGVVGEGYIAHNCAEATLENGEPCNLVEIGLANINPL